MNAEDPFIQLKTHWSVLEHATTAHEQASEMTTDLFERVISESESQIDAVLTGYPEVAEYCRKLGGPLVKDQQELDRIEDEDLPHGLIERGTIEAKRNDIHAKLEDTEVRMAVFVVHRLAGSTAVRSTADLDLGADTGPEAPESPENLKTSLTLRLTTSNTVMVGRNHRNQVPLESGSNTRAQEDAEVRKKALRYLVEHQGEPVGRQEIWQAMFGDEPFNGNLYQTLFLRWRGRMMYRGEEIIQSPAKGEYILHPNYDIQLKESRFPSAEDEVSVEESDEASYELSEGVTVRGLKAEVARQLFASIDWEGATTDELLKSMSKPVNKENRKAVKHAIVGLRSDLKAHRGLTILSTGQRGQRQQGRYYISQLPE